MNDRADRRTDDRDPIDVLTPEVFALLKLCGDVRATDLPQKPEQRQHHSQSFDRRRSDKRLPETEAQSTPRTADRRRPSQAPT